MSQAYEFIKSCGAFFVLTLNGDFPAGRPFGAIMEHEGDLYISTGDMKAVHHQLKDCPNVQIVALKPGTRAWIRVTGTAAECTDTVVKQKMLEACPALTNHFPTPDAPHFVVFRIRVLDVQMN
ncbi:MAG: pyridoxamine 5'-phosphate oxidase family protein [Candidatus Ventricola sp.]